jgi:PLP dependent protein
MIRDAAARVGRDANEVTLVGITKLVGTDEAKEIFDLGLRDLGENRVQELERKREALPRGVRWHLVGPIQANKARKAVMSGALLHAIDDPELVERLERIAGEEQARVRCLVEVNVSGEASKHGFPPGEVLGFLEHQRNLKSVEIAGLMTMAPLEARREEQLALFGELRRLRDVADQRRLFHGDSPRGELSMGMSHDFEAAVEQGATFVRVGTALFEKGAAEASAT